MKGDWNELHQRNGMEYFVRNWFWVFAWCAARQRFHFPTPTIRHETLWPLQRYRFTANQTIFSLSTICYLLTLPLSHVQSVRRHDENSVHAARIHFYLSFIFRFSAFSAIQLMQIFTCILWFSKSTSKSFYFARLPKYITIF